MLRPLFLSLLLVAAPAFAQSSDPDPVALAEVQRKGQQIALYNEVVERATSALAISMREGLRVPEEFVSSYVVLETDEGWQVAFGGLNSDASAFMVAAEVLMTANRTVREVRGHELPIRGSNDHRDRALAVQTAINNFPFEDIPYNFVVVSAPEGDLFVYVMPAQVQPGLYPLGGDTRFRFNPRIRKITDQKILHPTIQIMASEIDGEPVPGTMSVALNARMPVETDVFLAMHRKPAIPHYVLTSDWVFRIDPSGAIQPVPAEEFGMDE